MVNLFIAVPCYGGKLHADFAQSLLRLTAELGVEKIDCTVDFIGTESLICRARNTFVSKFYANPRYTHLLFLDSDLIFNPKAIITMIKRNKELIGCPYPKKMYNVEKMNALQEEGIPFHDMMGKHSTLITDINYNFISDDANTKYLSEGSCYLAKDIPTGCMLIKRSALTAMMMAYPERQFRNNIFGLDSRQNDYYFDFFATGVVEGIYLSEDYYFCFLAKSIALECWIECGYTFGHIGVNTYYGNLEEQLQNFGMSDSLNLDKKLLSKYNETSK
tara:strand:- start:8642 stop:9466 length:825 start_codon:yes stop_codon:yes gene_type:complete